VLGCTRLIVFKADRGMIGLFGLQASVLAREKVSGPQTWFYQLATQRAELPNDDRKDAIRHRNRCCRN